jgi:hypothetical protein
VAKGKSILQKGVAEADLRTKGKKEDKKNVKGRKNFQSGLRTKVEGEETKGQREG